MLNTYARERWVKLILYTLMLLKNSSMPSIRFLTYIDLKIRHSFKYNISNDIRNKNKRNIIKYLKPISQIEDKEYTAELT